MLYIDWNGFDLDFNLCFKRMSMFKCNNTRHKNVSVILPFTLLSVSDIICECGSMCICVRVCAHVYVCECGVRWSWKAAQATLFQLISCD